MRMKLASNKYGKSSVKLLKVTRGEQSHDIIDLSVNITLQGDMHNAYVNADNSNVVPTDTMKNTVYVLAKQKDFQSIEEFASILAHHFIDTYSQITKAKIKISSSPWSRIISSGQPAPYGFIRQQTYTDTCQVKLKSGKDLKTKFGIDNMTVLKSTNSGFENFHKDEYTTLKETSDRVLATTISAEWVNNSSHQLSHRKQIREILLDIFASHDSKSVQHTLFAMGESVIRQIGSVEKIKLSMPNQHKILANLDPFNLDNDNEIFIPTSEPFGEIEATLERD